MSTSAPTHERPAEASPASTRARAKRGHVTEQSERLAGEALRLLDIAREKKLVTDRQLSADLQVDCSQLARFRAMGRFTIEKLPRLIELLRAAGCEDRRDETSQDASRTTVQRRVRSPAEARARSAELWAETNRKIHGGKFTREVWIAHLREEHALSRVDAEISIRPICSQGAVRDFVKSEAEILALLAPDGEARS